MPNWQQNVNKTTTQVKNIVTNPMHEERQRNNSCFICRQHGHYAKQCPKNKKTNALSWSQVNFMESQPSQQNFTGHVHHISADEAQEKPEVIIGMFSVNDIPAIILFDSGASHSFISRSFAAQNKFPCTLLGKNMLVQTPGSIIKSNLVCRDLEININGVYFPTSLIIIESEKVVYYIGYELVDPISSLHKLRNPRSHFDQSEWEAYQILRSQEYTHARISLHRCG